MAKKFTFSSLSAIKESWEFYKKQPALNGVLLWFFIIPSYATDLVIRLLDPFDPLGAESVQKFFGLYDPYKFSLLLALLLIFFISMWGVASILLVGKRLVQSKAGRSRTSFHSVAGDSLPLVTPLFFTSVLRTCITLYWSLLFIIPATFALLHQSCQMLIYDLMVLLSGTTQAVPTQSDLLESLQHCGAIFLLFPLLIPAIWYAFRTTFFPMVVINEDSAYRQALKRSKDLVRGKVRFVLMALVCLFILLIGPAQVFAVLIHTLFLQVAPAYALIGDLITETAFAFSSLLFLLSMTILYGHLKNRPVEVKPS